MTITLRGNKARASSRPRFGLAWVTWRQQRATLLVLAGLAGAVAAVMLAAGLRGHALYPAFVKNHCLQVAGPGVTEVSSSLICRQLGGQFPGIGGPFYLLSGHTAVVVNGSFLNSYPTDMTLALLAMFLLTGMFLGAPLLGRELGQGTFRFAWTQGTSPVRWCVSKLLLLGGAVMAAGAGLGALGAWSLQPFNLAAGTSRWQDGQFETTVLTAAAWAGLAFVLGAFSGTLLRRTVPAMAATAAGAGVLLAATFWKLYGLLLGVHPLITQDNAQASAAGLATTAAPVRLLDVPLGASAGHMNPGPPGSLLLRGWYAGPDGRRLTGAPAEALINAYQRSPAGRDWAAWLSRHHDTFLVSYQPAGRYWIFQGVEAGALLLLALLLGAATIWLVVRSRGARIRGRRPGPG
jgi:hypothetical protein